MKPNLEKTNSVFIATSIDGHIADRDGEIDWLQSVANPNNEDMGYNAFMSNIDAIVMGKTTYKTVCAMDIGWPYQQPVFVLSTTIKSIPKSQEDKVFILSGTPSRVVEHINHLGFNRLYIDGGNVIRQFLKADLIHQMIITTIPVLLGGGTPLFGNTERRQKFELVSSKVYLEQVVQNHYKRIAR